MLWGRGMAEDDLDGRIGVFVGNDDFGADGRGPDPSITKFPLNVDIS